jgi:HPt (histidine-containing phosphotransfer) domain-containing protein
VSIQVLDLAGALARLGGDRQLYVDMVQFLREDCPGLMDELQAGISAGDASTVQRAAHSLKGLIANCGGVRAAEAAQRVENAGAEGDLEDAAHLLEPFRRELEALMQAVADVKSQGLSASSTHAH